MANGMTYPGNPSLPPEVKERVLSTFRQTVDLLRNGKSDDTIVGCDFVLEMDPMFGPAKQLKEMARNPSGADPSSLLANLPSDPVTEAREALAARDFERTVQLCNSILARDRTNAEAQEIAAQAVERMESAPFVEQFLTTSRAQIASGNEAAARGTLDKARALDPNHPGIAELQKSMSGSMSFDFGASGFGEQSSSFVVDQSSAPAGKSASGAPATDFGFTFEEENKPSAPAFDAAGGADAFSFAPDTNIPQAAPLPPPGSFASDTGPSEASTFDFAMAGVEVSADDQAKISRYLAEGDQAHERGDFPTAIDTWSRIFLIDVTNEQASERIERARTKRMDIDRRLEELLVAGTLAYDKKDFTTARMKFEEAIRHDPSNTGAAEYLQKISARGGADFSAELPLPSSGEKPGADLLDDLTFESEGTGSAAAIPSPAKVSKKAAAAPAGEKEKSKTLLFAAIGGAAIVLLAVGWFAMTKLGGSKAEYDPAATRATFNKAQSLADRGQIDQAIQLLSKITPTDPEHDRALVLIADLRKKKATTSELVDGRPAAEVFAERVGAAQVAFAAHDFLGAKQILDKAAEIKPLPPDAKAIYDAASLQVAKLDNALVYFKEGNYTEAINNLESLLLQDPANANIKQLLSNAHFNLGAVALQEERTKDAITEFAKVLEQSPADDIARRSRELGERYDNAPKDLLYKIYVKYLPLR